MSLMLPSDEEMRITFEGVERSGNRVWKSEIGRRVLDSKCSSREGRGVWRVGRKKDPRPALRIKVLILVILFSAKVERRDAEAAEGLERDSVKGTMTRRLLGPTGREVRSAVDVVDERTVAITVVFGRRRRAAVRPRPIPVYI